MLGLKFLRRERVDHDEAGPTVKSPSPTEAPRTLIRLQRLLQTETEEALPVARPLAQPPVRESPPAVEGPVAESLLPPTDIESSSAQVQPVGSDSSIVSMSTLSVPCTAPEEVAEAAPASQEAVEHGVVKALETKLDRVLEELSLCRTSIAAAGVAVEHACQDATEKNAAELARHMTSVRRLLQKTARDTRQADEARSAGLEDAWARRQDETDTRLGALEEAWTKASSAPSTSASASQGRKTTRKAPDKNKPVKAKTGQRATSKKATARAKSRVTARVSGNRSTARSVRPTATPACGSRHQPIRRATADPAADSRALQ